jgi:hypothetical protein
VLGYLLGNLGAIAGLVGLLLGFSSRGDFVTVTALLGGGIVAVLLAQGILRGTGSEFWK